MKIVEQSWEWVQKPALPLQIIELAGRTCYKSESMITEDSSKKFVKMILKRGHESVIEHISASVRFITDRGVTHEMVRHRLCAFSQESTRYVNYKSDDIQFIKPVWYDNSTVAEQSVWDNSCKTSEADYKLLSKLGWTPEKARSVLNNSLKTEIVVTCNVREWRHIFKLRTGKAAHPQMRRLMMPCLDGFKQEIPIVFDSIGLKV